MEAPPNSNLYIADLPKDIDVATLTAIFTEYGSIMPGQLKLLQTPGRKSAAMIRFQLLEEAQWIKQELDGNIPQGLSEPIIVRYADTPEIKAAKQAGYAYGPMQQAWEPHAPVKGAGWKGATQVARPAPYTVGKGVGVPGKAGGKGKSCSIKTLQNGLIEAKALPGSNEMSNDKNALYISGLPSDTQDIDLYKIFAPFGPIAPRGVRAMLYPDGTCQGFGFVNFLQPEHMQAAADLLNGTSMPDGKELVVKPKAPKKAP
ncbi:unnamed protein product [Effrenium voratum]|nr:unnamed protein product [Effrenium voratum]